MSEDERLDRGRAVLGAIHGDTGRRVVEALAEVAPDFADMIFGFAYGEVYARPGLDLRSRQIATIAALTALGHAGRELKVHLKAGLNLGLRREELVEILMQMAVYAGFPAALDALLIARELFAELDATAAADPAES